MAESCLSVYIDLRMKPATMNSARVLIVEDDFLIRLTLSEALAADGFDVVEAGSADEAAEMLASGLAVGLLLTDIQLPGKRDGWALAHEARLAQPNLPVIFTTGSPNRDPHAALHPADLYIEKPYLPSRICAAARTMLGLPASGRTRFD